VVRRWRTWLVVFIVVVFWPRSLSGSQQGQSQPVVSPESVKGRRWAIVVGISQYASLSEVSRASRDAKEFADLLPKVDSGLDEKNVRLRQNATLYEIRRAFQEIRSLKEPLDVLYFYFAGYGVGDKADGYLLPEDVKLDELPSRSLTMRELQGKLEDNPAKNIILIVDAAYHHTVGSALRLSSPNENQIIEHLKAVSKDLRWVTLLTVSSSTELSGADEGSTEGNFTEHLVQGMKGEADSDKDGVVRASELSKYLRERLAQQTGNRQQFDCVISRADPVLASKTKPSEVVPLPVPTEKFSEVPPQTFSKSHPGQPVEPQAPAPVQPKPPEPRPTVPFPPTTTPAPDRATEAGKDKVSQLEEAIRLDPRNVNAHYELGEAYMESGRYTDAAREFQFIISNLGRDESKAHNGLARAYQYLGQFDKAEREYRCAIELEPKEPNLYYNLGHLYYSTQRYAEAVEQFDKALNLDPPNRVEIYYNKGLAYYQQGNYTAAIRQYDEALKLDSSRAEIYYAKGLAYHQQKSYAEAIQQYEAALKLDPTGKKGGFDPDDLRKRVEELKARTTR